MYTVWYALIAVVLLFNAAVLIGHITGFVRPSVCLSLRLYWLLSRKWKRSNKTKLFSTFHSARGTISQCWA